MRIKIAIPVKLACLLALAVGIWGFNTSAQNIAWGPATGITGDINLVTGGTYVDGFLPSENMDNSSPLTADGMTFHVNSTGASTTAENDGLHISLVSNDLPLQFYGGPNSQDNFPTTSPSSPAFAAVMDAGGLYQTPGTGTGTVTLYGLTPGQRYAVQVYSADNFTGTPWTFTANTPGFTKLSPSASDQMLSCKIQ